jgi:hypothetical protein
MSSSIKVQQLADLLREAGAKPRVSPDRVVRSTLYDLDYHIALIACVFFIVSEQRTDGTRSVVAHWLKILQFIAVRPALLPDFLRWARTRRRPDLDTWQLMPRGYLGDRTHDRTVEFLVATNVLHRTADSLIGGEAFAGLHALYHDVMAKGLLRSEREALQTMSSLPVNKTLLGGQ